MCVGVILLCRPELEPKVIATAWLVAALISCVLALFQYFGLSHYLAPIANAASEGEAFANLRQRNQFASLCNIGFLALLWFVDQGLLSRGRWGMFLAAMLAAGNAASVSRTGLVQLILIGCLGFLWQGRSWQTRSFWAAALTTYICAASALPVALKMASGNEVPNILSRIQTDLGCSSRSVLWSNVMDLITLKPWFGWGWGELDFAHYVTRYSRLRFCDILDNAHNLPLHLAVEMGVPAAIFICGGFLWWVVRQRPWREADPTRQLAWGVLAMILLHSMLEYPLWYGPFQMAFVLCVFLLCRRPESQREFEGSKRASTIPVGRLSVSVLALGLMALIAYAMWDYHRISQIYLAPEQRHPAYRENSMVKASNSWLFSDQVRFAELHLTPLTRENAAWTFARASAMLHYSPEPRVIEKVIESAVFLGRDDDAAIELARYRVAFPKEHAMWAASLITQPSTGLSLRN